MHYPRIMVAAANSGVGKSTISLGLMAALAGLGQDVRPFKVGPDYIDPGLHEAACGRASHNLDAWLMPMHALNDLFRSHARHGEQGLSIIEGVMGLFDGLGGGAFASTAHIASLLHAPVLLVINAEGTSLSAAALAHGFASFKPAKSGPAPDLSGLRVGGVFLNRVAGQTHARQMARAIEEHTGLPCLGCLPKNAAPPMPQGSLGLVQASEQRALPDTIARLAQAIREHTDLEAVLSLARSAPPLPKPGVCAPPAPPVMKGLRLGLAKDAAFSFYYPDSLERLAQLGAEIIPFSPLTDERLPQNLQGLYLGGGLPECFAAELAANKGMRSSLRQALEAGLPAYAESGGMLYLCRSLAPAKDAPAHAMSGYFPHSASMTSGLQPFGYVTLNLEQDCLLGPANTQFKAHEFHYSVLQAPAKNNTAPCPELREGVMRAEKADGRAWQGGLARMATLAWYPHLHFRGCPDAARNFLTACASWAQKRSKKQAPHDKPHQSS